VNALIANTRDARLARWAASALASSLVLIAIAIAAVVFASDLSSVIREHPVGVAVVALLLGCYAISFICLHKIQRGSVQAAFFLWGLSFFAAVGPLVALILWFGPVAGSIIGFAEIIALGIHLAALANV
jgi:hypothetical protein